MSSLLLFKDIQGLLDADALFPILARHLLDSLHQYSRTIRGKLQFQILGISIPLVLILSWEGHGLMEEHKHRNPNSPDISSFA